MHIDLKSLNIHDFGMNQTHGGGARGISREMRPPDFLIDGKRLIVARWLNPGDYAEMDQIIDPGVNRSGHSGRGEIDANPHLAGTQPGDINISTITMMV